MSDVPITPSHDQPFGLDHNQLDPAFDSARHDQLDAILRADALAWRTAAPSSALFEARVRAALTAVADARPATAPSLANTEPNPASHLAANPAPLAHATQTRPPEPRVPSRRRGLLAIVAMAAVVALLVGLLQLVGPHRGGSIVHPAPSPSAPAFPTTALATPVPSTGTPAACNDATQWRASDNNTWLNDMTMVSPDEGWAVGAQEGDPRRNPGIQPQGVIFHYANGQWQRLPQTYPGVDISTLSMGSPTDGWAAADTSGTGQDTKAFVLHYTGGQWQQVDIPTLDAIVKGPPGSFGGALMWTRIQMVSASAGWLFAQTGTPRNPSNPASRPVSVVLRYEHDGWTPLPMPSLTDTTQLFQLSAVSADEAWVVGTDYSTNLHTLFLHYAHGQWTTYPQTFPGVTEFITMVSPTEGWAFSDPTVLHYDGHAWKPFALPAQLTSLGIALTESVFPIAPGITWFGAYYNTGVRATASSLILQEANGQWQPIAWPYAAIAPQQIVSPAPGDLQIVGNILHVEGCAPALVGSIAQGVFLRYHNGHWSESILP